MKRKAAPADLAEASSGGNDDLDTIQDLPGQDQNGSGYAGQAHHPNCCAVLYCDL